jgi:hypothetical protein
MIFWQFATNLILNELSPIHIPHKFSVTKKKYLKAVKTARVTTN